MAADAAEPFDPRAILSALERRRVAYIVIGAVARVLHGTDEVTDGLDVCPQLRPENAERLADALEDLGALGAADRNRVTAIAAGTMSTFDSAHGPLKIVPTPEGTRGGWDDLRRHANRDALGDGLRVPVAALDDLLRMTSALNREQDQEVRRQMRRLQELDRSPSLGR